MLNSSLAGQKVDWNDYLGEADNPAQPPPMVMHCHTLDFLELLAEVCGQMLCTFPDPVDALVQRVADCRSKPHLQRPFVTIESTDVAAPRLHAALYGWLDLCFPCILPRLLPPAVCKLGC